MRRFWENYLHLSINKSCWKEEEIEKLRGIVEQHQSCNWDQIAEDLGVSEFGQQSSMEVFTMPISKAVHENKMKMPCGPVTFQIYVPRLC